MSTLVGRVPGIIDAHVHFFDPRTPPWSLERLGRASTPLLRTLPSPLLRVASRFNHELSRSGVAGRTQLTMRYGLREYTHDLAGLDTVAGVPVTAVMPVDSLWRRSLSADDVRRAIERDLANMQCQPYGVGNPAIGGLIAPADERLADLGLTEVLDGDDRGHIRGFRLRWGRDPDPLIHDWSTESGALRSANFQESFGALVERGLVFESLCYANELGEINRLAAEYPKATIIIDNFGSPLGVFGPLSPSTGTTAAARADILNLWRERMTMLAARPNVMVKLNGIASSLLGYGQEKSGNIGGQRVLADMMGPLVLHIVDRFGPERVIFGSNAPLDAHNATIGVVVGALIDILGDRGDYLLSHLFYENARRVYRIVDTPAAAQ